MEGLKAIWLSLVPYRKKPTASGSEDSKSARADGVVRIYAERQDARTLALTRCVLCIAVVVVMYADPTEPARLVDLTHLWLAGYTAYAFAVLLRSSRTPAAPPSRKSHWIDVFAYAGLVAVTGGASSVFFFLFFFSILLASFTYGYREGIAVTVFAVLCLLFVGAWNEAERVGLTVELALSRSGYLFLFGFIVAHWGANEVLTRRKMRLLQDVNSQWNPRFGVEHTIAVNLDRLLTFYGADQCLFVMCDSGSVSRAVMFTASTTRLANASAPVRMTRQAVNPFLSLPEALSVCYAKRMRKWSWRTVRCVAYERNVRVEAKGILPTCDALEDMLDAPFFLTAPYSQRDGTAGRIYVSSQSGSFSTADLEFLLQFVGTMSPVVENLQLMDELISKASEHERYKISRDIHDTTIQPYIGLKLGLQALAREAAGGRSIEAKLQDLIEMTNMTVSDLRKYAAQLRDETTMPGDFLLAAVNEQAKRYKRFYGIEIETNMDIGKLLTGRLAAEVFQIIAEGLSNIVKHTAAKRGFVTVLYDVDVLMVKVGNELTRGTRPEPFVPRTINERAQVLGGSAYTELDADGYTVVHVNISLAS